MVAYTVRVHEAQWTFSHYTLNDWKKAKYKFSSKKLELSPILYDISRKMVSRVYFSFPYVTICIATTLDQYLISRTWPDSLNPNVAFSCAKLDFLDIILGLYHKFLILVSKKTCCKNLPDLYCKNLANSCRNCILNWIKF